MILRTEAVVLRSLPYGETSRIVTLYTRNKGKLSVIAKGARLPKSKFGSTLQALSVVQAVLYYRPTRTLQTLSECAHTFVSKLDDLDRLAAGLRVLELTNALVQAEEESPTVFDLLVLLIARLHGPHTSATLLQLYYEMQLATALGFAPHCDYEAVRSLPASGGTLLLETGLIVAEGDCGKYAIRASRTALRTFAILSRAQQMDTVASLAPSRVDEVHHLVAQYLRFHVAEAYPERSRDVLRQMRSMTPLA